MLYEKRDGVPRFSCEEYRPKQTKYCVLIPVINEGERIIKELCRAKRTGVMEAADVAICDGGTTDGSLERTRLETLGVNTLLVKEDTGKQGAQLRMGIWWALQRGYSGVVTIDGNNKDSIEDVPAFIARLEEGYDLVQGSRFIQGGRAVRTPMFRYAAIRLLHAPLISLTAGAWFTDTTNAYRAYSAAYLTHPAVQPLRDIFQTYELLAYLSVRASQLGMRTCEIPVVRAYPKSGKMPTKISMFRGNAGLLEILFANMAGKYHPKNACRKE